MPLPPYIHEKLEDQERYQTVYAKENGSAAAPTAGLHFTPELLQKIEDKGVHLVYLTLHVGLGTFRPVSVDDLDQHEMHSEFYQLSEEAAQTLQQVKASGHRIVAVGTTSIRTLETIGNKFNGDQYLYQTRLSVAGCRRLFNQLPPTKINPSHARFCLRRSRTHSGCLSARYRPRLPFLQLWRCYVYQIRRAPYE